MAIQPLHRVKFLTASHGYTVLALKTSFQGVLAAKVPKPRELPNFCHLQNQQQKYLVKPTKADTFR